MTLSQLIVQLQELQELQELQSQYSHLGDLEVMTYSVSGDEYYSFRRTINLLR